MGERVLLMRALARRLRAEGGFTLPEMLTGMTIAVVVSLATFALIEFTITRTHEVQGRVEASQKGRAAMDTMTRQLRSQVCLSTTVPPMAGAKPDKASFYVDLTDGSTNAPPELRELTYNPTTKRVVESTFVGTGVSPNITFPAAPTRTKQLVENVVPYRPPAATADLPIFRYYAFNSATPPRPATQLPTPLSATDLGRVARIEIAYRTLPPRQKASNLRGSIVLQDEVYVRAADPNSPAPTPTCA